MPHKNSTSTKQMDNQKSNDILDKKMKRKPINMNKENKNKPDYFVEYPNKNRRLHFKSVSNGRKYMSLGIRNYKKL